MLTCGVEKCDVIVQLRKMNTKLTILTVMIAVLLSIVTWAVYTVLIAYDFEYETTTITIDSSSGTGDAIYQDGEVNTINGKDYSENDKIKP